MRTVLVFVAWAATVVTANAAELPFRPATPWEVSGLIQGGVLQPGVIATPLNTTNFNTAATVTVHKKNGLSLAPSNTQRNSMALSKVYKHAMSAGPTPIGESQPAANIGLMDSDVSPNSVQAWATMSERGAPYMFVYSNGQSDGQSAASWSTQYTVTGSGNRDVYAQFTIPAATFKSRWEDYSPSLTRARLRIDFLVNGYPAWSTETIRFNEMDSSFHQKGVYLETFGDGIGLNALDTITAASAAKTITVKLGTYPGGKVLDLTQLFQADAQVDSLCVPEFYTSDVYDGVTLVHKKGDPVIDKDTGLQEYSCGEIDVKIDWNPEAPQPTLYSKPAPLPLP